MTFEIGMCISKCGLCCHSFMPCDACIAATLRANDVNLDTEENRAMLKVAPDEYSLKLALSGLIAAEVAKYASTVIPND